MEAQAGKHLTFVLNKEEYGIPINRVKEIIGMMDITSIPRTPKFIKGVVNLRGKIIPLMDLRLKLDMGEQEYTERTCIIVVELNFEGVQRQMGIVVDTVSEVVNIQANELEPPPQYGTQVEGDFLIGIGKVKGKVILLLDIQRVLNPEEMKLLKEIKGA